MRRTAAWKPIGIVAATTIAIAGFGVAPATAAEDDPSQALAEVLRAQLLGGDLASAGSSYASAPGGPASDEDPLNLTLLGGSLVEVAPGIQLPLLTDGTAPGLLDLGQAGALSSYASTPSASSSVAASGLLTDDGAIEFDVDEVPPTGGTASVDVTALLEQLGLGGATSAIVDELALEIGAVASRAEMVDGVLVSDDYRVADLVLTLDSPATGALVSDLNTGLGSLVTTLQTDLNPLLAPTGPLGTLLGTLDISVLGLVNVDLSAAQVGVTLPDLESIINQALGGSPTSDAIVVSGNGAIAINLTQGTIDVDLAQIVNPTGVGLNGQDPNTPVLDSETLTAITSGVTSALGSIVAPVTTALTDVFDQTELTIVVPVNVTALFGGAGIATGSISIAGSITEILDEAEDAIDVSLTLLPNLLPITLDGLTNAVTDLVAAPLLAGLGGIVSGVFDTANAGIPAVLATLDTAVGSLLTGLSPVLSALNQVVSITVNAQPSLLDPPTADIEGGFTVRAIEVTLLPLLSDSTQSTISLASSTVLAAAEAGTLTIDPSQAHPEDTVDLGGAGWDPEGGDVVVTFRDADGVQVGSPVTLPVDEDGDIAGEFTVPEGTDAGVLTATADQDGATTTADLEVVDAPVVIVDPNPVDPGETITITGAGFLCGPVDVTITGGPEPVEFLNVPVAEDGSWSVQYLVPADIEVSSLLVTAVGVGVCDEEGETPVDVDLPETVELTPGEVRGGDTIDIAGDGWAEGANVTVDFTDVDGNPVGTAVIVPGEGGTLDGEFVVPPGTAPGPLTGTASQGDDSTTDSVTVFADASLSVDPASIRAGGEVDVTGGGWLPSGGDVVVTFRDADDAVVGSVTTTPTAAGLIVDTFVVPAGTDPGILTATAVQGDVDAVDTLAVVPTPSVTVDPDVARPGDVVDVTGIGWTDGSPVSVIFTDEDDVQVGEALSLTPVAGVIDGTFAVPGTTEPGTLTATATQGTDSATDELEVTLAPTVTATPSQLHGGDVITIGGGGWDDASPVVVTVTDADGTVVGTPVSITPVDGVITDTYPVPEGVDPGTLTVTAEQGTDDATDTVELVADPTVVVTPNPADPGQQVTISGSGFLCGPVTVTIGTTPPTVFTDVPVVDGQWSQVWTVPAGITVDSVTITAVATGACDDEGETVLDVDLAETLTATPAFAQRGEVVTVAGTGWDDGVVTITAIDAAGTTVAAFPVIAVDGSFSRPFTVPTGTALGALEFQATQGDDAETATVTVVSIPAGPPTLIVSPSTVEPGDVVAIDGSGWDPTAGVVTITIRNAQGATIGSVPTNVNPIGALVTAAFTVPAGTVPQTLTATAVQGPRTASDDFSVRQANLPVIRLAGPERFQTAVEISRDAFPFGADVVYLANAVKFPDALSAAPAAAQQDAPLLLTRQDTLDAATIQELDRLRPDTIVVVGDQNSVSANVVAQATPYTGEVIRLGGADRFETSILIAEYAFNGAASAYVATGFNFPDALTAGAAAGSNAAPLLLTYGAQPQPALLEALDGLGVSDIYIAGNGIAVPTTQEAAYEAAGFDVVERYAGVDRYDTGVLVAQDSFAGPVERIYVATGIRFPDALAGSAVAGAQRVPVYVSPPNCMWGDVLDEIDRLGDPQVVLLGDELALDANVFALQSCG